MQASAQWKAQLKRQLSWSLTLKLLLLLALWALFFSPRQRVEVTPEITGARLAVEAAPVVHSDTVQVHDHD